jgi:hypothetical protein
MHCSWNSISIYSIMYPIPTHTPFPHIPHSHTYPIQSDPGDIFVRWVECVCPQGHLVLEAVSKFTGGALQDRLQVDPEFPGTLYKNKKNSHTTSAAVINSCCILSLIIREKYLVTCTANVTMIICTYFFCWLFWFSKLFVLNAADEREITGDIFQQMNGTSLKWL